MVVAKVDRQSAKFNSSPVVHYLCLAVLSANKIHISNLTSNNYYNIRTEILHQAGISSNV